LSGNASAPPHAIGSRPPVVLCLPKRASVDGELLPFTIGWSHMHQTGGGSKKFFSWRRRISLKILRAGLLDW